MFMLSYNPNSVENTPLRTLTPKSSSLKWSQVGRSDRVLMSIVSLIPRLYLVSVSPQEVARR